MGNTHKEVAEAQTKAIEKQDFSDALDSSTKMINERFSSF